MDFVHHSLKKTSEEIQQYSFSMQKVIGSQDSGIVDAVDSFQRADNDVTNGRLLMEQLCMNSDEERQQELITDILTELSNHNARTMERRKAMTTLKYMTRDGTFTLWDEHFKAILLILLETLGDNDPEIRAMALRVMGEICLSQAPRFCGYAELTILRVVDAHGDDDKEVVRAAEECAAILANHLPPPLCLRILNPIVKSDEPKGSLAAIKMVTKALEKMSPTEVEAVLPDIIPLVIKAYEHPTQSVIRKASVVCLVAFHQVVGIDKLDPYLLSLPNNKLKLLNLYIKRAETNSASPTSQI